MNELIDACRKELSVVGEAAGTAIVDLMFTEMDAESFQLLAEIPENELLETLQESMDALDHFIWIQGIQLQQASTETEPSPLAATLVQTIEGWSTEEWKVVLKDLYRHPKSSRFLEPLADQSAADLQLAATQKIRRSMQAGE